MKRYGMALVLVLVTIIGGGLAIFGTGGDRVLGVSVALMFGGGGLAWWMVNRPRQAAMPGFQVGAVTTVDGREVAFVAHSDRKVLIAGVVGCLAFAGGMLLIGLGPARPDGTEGVLLVAGGLFMIGVGLFGLMRIAASSHLALTRRGLHATGPGGWFVPWDAIAWVGDIAVHGNPFVAVRLTDPRSVEVGRSQRIVRWLQRSVMGVDLSIPIRTLTVDPAELFGAIARYREHPEHRGRIGTTDELAAIRSAAAPEINSPPVRGPRRRRSIRRILAIGSLLLAGGVFVLLSIGVAFDEVPPGRELARAINVVLLGGFAIGQLVAGGLLIRNVRIGRRIAIGSTAGIIALILYGLARSDPDRLLTGLTLLALVAGQLLLVVFGARVDRDAGSLSGVYEPDELHRLRDQWR